jgi:hypothetical protein
MGTGEKLCHQENLVILTLSLPKGKDLLFAARNRSFASLRMTNNN